MLTHYLKSAWRNIKANKLFSTLNIAGLAIGIAICIPLFLFVMEQLRFDGMYKNKENIYRINLQTEAGKYTAGSETWAVVPNAVGPNVAKEIPEVKYAGRMLKNGFGSPASLKIGQKTFIEKGLYWCDPDIFKIFDLPFLQGNPATALAKPNTIAISEAAATRLFGKENPMGKIIEIDNQHQLQVTGVYQTPPTTSTIDCDMMATFLSNGFNNRLSWGNASFETYCLLNKGADMDAVDAKLKALVNKNIAKDEQWFGLKLQPLKEIHLYSTNISNSYTSHVGSIKEVKNLALLALLILVIACINYMNLSTARSEHRAKEVGINKTLGASRGQMIKRFYTETALIVLVAILLGYALSFGSIYLFNYVAEKHLLLSGLYALEMLAGLLLLWLVVTVVAGSYPALVLSAFSPLTLMRKKITQNSFDNIFRKGLVVLQFTCSVVLIVAVIVVAQQMRFISNKDLGFHPSGVLSLSLSGVQNAQQLDALKNNLKNVAGVTDVSATQSIPGEGASGRSLYKSADDKNGLQMSTCHSDAAIVKTLGLRLLAGKGLPQNIAKTDTGFYAIVNEKAIDYLGYTPEQAIGKRIIVMGMKDNAVISGVVANFNYESLRQPIGAYMYYEGNHSPEGYYAMLVRFSTANVPQTMQQLEAAFKKSVPSTAFDYTFLDNSLAAMYQSEKIISRVSVLFSALAIFVSCLGLFGLAAFTAEKRIKEIGIRKVLGASVLGITRLLTKDFLKLVLLSVVLAVPLAVMLMNSWLQGFSYRISISWIVLFLAAILAVLIALLTIGFQSIRAARTNPVKSLKTE